MEKRWVLKPEPESGTVKEVVEMLKVNEALAKILCQRDICTFDEAFRFFRPSLDHLHDPFLMRDMDKAVERLTKAWLGKEKILIYGDYDVDGTTSVALVYGFLADLFEEIEFYIPDRFIEGYGISNQGVEWAELNNCSLIIALDCGIKSRDKVEYATSKGIDFIICDHHTVEDGHMPEAVAVLDPKRPDCDYPFKELSGCGIGFKLLQAFCLQHNGLPLDKLYSWLDLVAVSIAADIVPITGENRVLATFGLKMLNQELRPGLEALRELAGLKGELDISSLVFGFAPRINAAGRLGDAKRAVEMLLAPTLDEAHLKAEVINETNKQRKNFDANITKEALAMIEENADMLGAKSTVLYKESWQKGVIGIVASRCIENYYRPTIILTHSNGKAAGSARSVTGFDVYSAISECADLLDQFGGHKYAAGLTLPVENVPAFRKRFEEVVSSRITDEQQIPQIEIDQALKLSQVTPSFFRLLKQMAPFGPGNLQPLFMTENVTDTGESRVVGQTHLKLCVMQGNSMPVEGIAFGMAEHYTRIAKGEPFNMCYSIEENEYRGTVSLQLRVRDIKFE